ncbi:MAG: TraR/DksA family transcriptional regulator [Gemmataceae bacterium]
MSRAALSLQDLRMYRLQLESLIDPLREKIAELEAEALRPVAVAVGHPDQAPAHDADPGTRDAEDSVARTVLESEQSVLAEARAALSRLDAGTFGHCERCSHAIGKTRLTAIPYARYCISCARDIERVA